MKSLVLKVKAFPEVSETWMFTIIKLAKSKGVKIFVLTDLIQDFSKVHFNPTIPIVSTENFDGIKFSNRKRQALKMLVKKPYLIRFYIKYFFLKKKHSLNYIFRLYNYSKYRDIEVFHVHFANASKPLDELKAIGFIKGKIIVTCHGYDVHFMNEKKRLYLSKLYETIFNQVDIITVNGSYLYEKVLKLTTNFNKLNIVKVGADETIFQPTIYPKSISSNSTINLISVGRLKKLKGHDFAIMAVSKLVNLGYDIIYRVVGEGKNRNYLENLITKYKLEKRVFLLGAMEQQDIAKYLDDSQLFLMSSVTDQNNRAEAQGLVLAEAQLMGLPIVAFDSGGVNESLSENTGILVFEKDYEAMANAIIEIIGDVAKYKMMSRKSRLLALERLSSENMYKSYYNLI